MSDTAVHTHHSSQRGVIVLLMATSLAVATSNSVIFAALSDLQDEFGFSSAGLGLIAGTGFLAGLLVNLFLAPLSDRGHSKRLIMLGMTLGAIGSVLLAFGESLGQFVFARAVIGSSFGLVFPSVRALLANVDIERRGLLLGRLAGVELLGFVLGPLVGGLMLDPFGVRNTFLFFVGLNLLSLAAVSPRTFPRLPETSESSRLSFELLRIPEIQAAVLVFMALQAPVGIFDALWDRYLTDLGGGNTMVGVSFALYTVPFILFSSYGGRLADRHEPIRIAMWSMILVVPAVTGYGLFSSIPPVILLNIVEGVVQALAYPAAAAAVAVAAPAGRASAAQGLAGASGLLMSALIAFTSPVSYGAFGGVTDGGNGAVVSFGAVGVLMAALTVAAALIRRASSASR
ncbi:MAG: MFS transporter [Ilumatobacteraceae bacterium]